TMKSPSPMPEQEMAGLHDDAGFLTHPSSAIVVYEERQLPPTKIEMENTVEDDPAAAIELENTDEDDSSTAIEMEISDEDDPPESPKGRGHRKKRKAVVLRTPWRNIEKRKKFTTVTEYDPHRPVDPVKFEDLQTWLMNSTESAEVELSCGGVARKKYFDDLVNDGWLTNE
ncbi:Unknown protein, partial [Striga hermonthica]